MDCGEFDIRNKEYNDKFSKVFYFQQLIFNKDLNKKIGIKGENRVIFDVGAHGGESAKFFSKIFPGAKIYSFEPIPKMAKTIKRLKIRNNIVEQCALSNFDGSQDFYIQDISHLSSLHKVNRNSKDSLGYNRKETQNMASVNVIRGDTYMKENNLSELDLLKIDVQANEAQALEGFSDTINDVKVVFVEVSFYDFYENKSSIKSIEEQLPNFELYDIFEISKNPKTLRTDWATLVYKNASFFE